jgi:hypothetical protein
MGRGHTGPSIQLGSQSSFHLATGRGKVVVTYLAAPIGAHCNIPVSTSCEARVDASTEGSLSFLAVSASTVRNVEGHDDTVTFLQQSDAFAHLVDYAHVLVPEGDAGFGASTALVHVEVGAADAWIKSRQWCS